VAGPAAGAGAGVTRRARTRADPSATNTACFVAVYRAASADIGTTTPRSRSRRVAEKPSIPGICMSIRPIRGRSEQRERQVETHHRQRGDQG